MRRSLRLRVVAGALLPALAAVLVAGVVAQSLVGRHVTQAQAATRRANAEAIAMRALPLVAPRPQPAALAELAASAAFLLNARVTIETVDGEPLADSSALRRAHRLSIVDGDAVAGFVSAASAPDDAPRVLALRFDLRQVDDSWPAGDVPRPPDEDAEGELDRVEGLFIRRVESPWGARLQFGEPGATGASSAVSVAREASAMGHIHVLRDQAAAQASGVGVGHGNGHGPSSGAITVVEEVRELRLPAAEVTNRVSGGMSLVADGPGWREAGIEDGARDGLRAAAAPASGGDAVVVPVGGPTRPLAQVRVHAPVDFAPAALVATRRAFVPAALVAALVALGVGLVAARGWLRPVTDLARTAGRMAEGDLSARAAVEREDELGQLATTFNRMAQRLEQSFEELGAERDALRRFVADASHELRTPITALTNFNQLLRDGAAEDADARGEFLDESAAQLERLAWITEHLLDLSRLDGGLVELELEPLTPHALLRDVAAPFWPRARERDVHLMVAAAATGVPPVPLDRARMALALSNLVDNALRHAPEGGHVTLGANLVADGRRLELWVADDGPGVALEDRGRIFERFQRGRDAVGDGLGLGLAMVRAVARAHGGVARVDDGLVGDVRVGKRADDGVLPDDLSDDEAPEITVRDDGNVGMRSDEAWSGGARFVIALPLDHAPRTGAALRAEQG